MMELIVFVIKLAETFRKAGIRDLQMSSLNANLMKLLGQIEAI